jgi:hypothetical protein
MEETTMQTTLRNAPIIGALLALCACAETATAPAAAERGTQPLDITVPSLAGGDASATTPSRSGPQRTSDLPLPPELDGQNVPDEYRTSPNITGYGLDITIGSGTATGYAWMYYLGTAARISLTLSAVADGKPGFGSTMPAEESHLFPGNYMLTDYLTIPFVYSCGGSVSGTAVFSAWHQFPLTSGAIFRWGDQSKGSSKVVSQEACVQEYKHIASGGSPHEDAVIPDEYDWYLCTFKLTYNWGVLVSVELVSCVPVA